ncbi:MAG: peptide chain release factor N(5)-glutamine methyltransferase [Flavipsychrobacter sp.]|nr:peptide chain release factor N(5)-glutamine methyltransferase [Flavipsychrobacter sp.]
MLTYTTAFHQLCQALQPLYDAREAAAIADQYLTHLTGADKLKRIVERDTQFTLVQEALWTEAKEQLAAGKPLQYVIGITWFMGREFIVNEHVLIPRPETEELVEWIIKDYKGKQDITIVDIGTGSGCIAISVKLGLCDPDWIRTNDPQLRRLMPLGEDVEITAFDISSQALIVATKNAENLQAAVTFQQLDILDESQWNNTDMYDVIVSNPPYIPVSEQEHMHTNVKDNEPTIALFVPNDDPLLFYKAIAQYGKAHLKHNGAIYCELHMSHAHQTAEMFRHAGYTQVLVKDDMHGNPRMLKAMFQ